MNDQQLLNLYRKKREVDGSNGRAWDARKHFEYDEAIEVEERLRGLCDKDVYGDAECSLLHFTETVCKIYGQYRGIYRLYLHLFEWLGDKLLWRKRRWMDA